MSEIKIFYIIISLEQHGENAIRFLARFGGQAFRYFFLDHTRANGDTVFVVQHLKEDLRGDIIRIIADDIKFAFGHDGI